MELVYSLGSDHWGAPTVARMWMVKDIAAHILDVQCRRLSFQRDGSPMPSSPKSDETLVDFLNRLNAEWVAAFRRVGPNLIIEMLEVVGPQLAEFFESLDPMEEAFLPVAWAGEEKSANWMDVGRDFTELWHHQAQIRLAVGASPLADDSYMTPLYQLAVLALPVTLRSIQRDAGAVVSLTITGPGAGSWNLRSEGSRWSISSGNHKDVEAVVQIDGQIAWKIFFNAIHPIDARELVAASGDEELINQVLRTRSVMV